MDTTPTSQIRSSLPLLVTATKSIVQSYIVHDRQPTKNSLLNIMHKLDFHDVQIDESSTIFDALNVLNETAAQIVLVVNSDLQLIGTLTDGDIRRGLINGRGLDAPVKTIMKEEFKFIYSEAISNISNLMDELSVARLPILDRSKRVVGLLSANIPTQQTVHENSIVIMAGGKGKRLWPYTKDCPKPMLLVDGKPILEILIEQCRDSGFNNFYLSVNYLKEVITDHFGDGSRWGVTINYLVETTPLGTAGSLTLLPKEIQKPLIVMNGDVLTKIKLKHILSFHNENNAAATVCARDHQVTIPFGVIEADGIDLSGFSEKPVYNYLVNAGLYVINPSVIDLIDKNSCTDMPDVLSRAKAANLDVCVCPIHEYWIDVGVPETMNEANKTWNNHDLKK